MEFSSREKAHHVFEPMRMLKPAAAALAGCFVHVCAYLLARY